MCLKYFFFEPTKSGNITNYHFISYIQLVIKMFHINIYCILYIVYFIYCMLQITDTKFKFQHYERIIILIIYFGYLIRK